MGRGGGKWRLLAFLQGRSTPCPTTLRTWSLRIRAYTHAQRPIHTHTQTHTWVSIDTLHAYTFVDGQLSSGFYLKNWAFEVGVQHAITA